MRLSTVEDDPGFKAWREFKGQPAVLLNGIEVELVETADEEEGEIVRLFTDEDGRLLLVPGTDEPMRETLRGRVEITTRQAQPFK